MGKKSSTFEITEDHTKLLQRMFVDWNGDECGAPQIDPKRPYGDGDVAQDIIQILEWEMPDDEDDAEALEEKAIKIHESMATVLQILLVCGIEDGLQLGNYRQEDPYDVHSWVYEG